MTADPALLLLPEWPVPARVRAVVTTRALPGRSQVPYQLANLASHVDDDPAAVADNRAALPAWVGLPGTPCWLEQVHGTEAARLRAGVQPRSVRADAAYTSDVGVVCTVLTADCLPVLLASQEGKEIAAVHAGWRGLADGVIEASIACFRAAPESLHAWLGPAISQAAFETGPEVREAFLAFDPAAESAFIKSGPGDRWHADLYALARLRLRKLGVSSIHGGGLCTVGDPQRFYSYRRDGARSGRFATLIWLA